MLKSAPRFALLTLLLASCAGPTPVRSPILCSAIAIQESESDALLDAVHQFATAEHLNGVVGIVASAYHDNRRSVELDVTTYLGPVGATVEVYALKSRYDQSLVERVRAHVEHDVGSRWHVRDCRDVPGLDLPQRIG